MAFDCCNCFRSQSHPVTQVQPAPAAGPANQAMGRQQVGEVSILDPSATQNTATPNTATPNTRQLHEQANMAVQRQVLQTLAAQGQSQIQAARAGAVAQVHPVPAASAHAHVVAAAQAALVPSAQPIVPLLPPALVEDSASRTAPQVVISPGTLARALSAGGSTQPARSKSPIRGTVIHRHPPHHHTRAGTLTAPPVPAALDAQPQQAATAQLPPKMSPVDAAAFASPSRSRAPSQSTPSPLTPNHPHMPPQDAAGTPFTRYQPAKRDPSRHSSSENNEGSNRGGGAGGPSSRPRTPNSISRKSDIDTIDEIPRNEEILDPRRKRGRAIQSAALRAARPVLPPHQSRKMSIGGSAPISIQAAKPETAVAASTSEPLV